MDEWSIRRVLAWTAKDFAARGIASARLDAELLIAEALSMDRVRLYMDLDRPLVEVERARIRDLVKRRRGREPVAYILGRRAFYGRDFRVSSAVLIPRPDTETLVERALALLGEEGRVLDLCTGSGAIGVTLAAERPGLSVDLADVSAEALAVARSNAEALGVLDRVRLFEGDLFDAVPPGERYDLVTVNPPYVTEAELAELMPEVQAHEPRLALVAGDAGFAVHDRLVQGAASWLADGGTLLVEVGDGQAEELRRRLTEAGWPFTAGHDDLSGVARVVEAWRSAREEDREAHDEPEEAEGADRHEAPDQPGGHP